MDKLITNLKNIFEKHKKIFIIFGILLTVYLLYFHNLWNYELLDVDETRYVDMSKTMFYTHDYLTLYLNGNYFFEKPPLYFWLENVSFLVFNSINEFSARIPGVIEGLLTGLILYIAVFKFTKDKFLALISSLILLSFAEFIILSKIAILDILLASTVSISILFGLITFAVSDKNKKFFWWGFYLFCALAVLAKGLPGLIIPFFAMFLIGIYTKKLKEYFKLQYFLVGILIFLIVVLPWHVIMFKIHDPLFFNEYIMKHHIARFLGGEVIGRDAPFWFYIPVLIWGSLPYAASFIAMLVDKAKHFRFKKYDESDLKGQFLILCAICAFAIFLFFESSKTKLVTYILPIYPFLAVILGEYWYSYIKEGKNKKYIEISSKIFNWAGLISGVIYIIVLIFIPQPLKNDLLFVTFPSLLCLFIFLTTGLVAIKKEKRLLLFISYLLFIACISAFGFHKFLKMDYRLGQYDLIKYAKYAKAKNFNIFTYETGAKYSLLYYSGKKARFDIKKEEIKSLLKNRFNVIIIRKKDLKNLDGKFKIIDVGRKYILIKN